MPANTPSVLGIPFTSCAFDVVAALMKGGARNANYIKSDLTFDYDVPDASCQESDLIVQNRHFAIVPRFSGLCISGKTINGHGNAIIVINERGHSTMPHVSCADCGMRNECKNNGDNTKTFREKAEGHFVITNKDSILDGLVADSLYYGGHNYFWRHGCWLRDL